MKKKKLTTEEPQAWTISEYECLLICGGERYVSPTFGFEGKDMKKFKQIAAAHNSCLKLPFNSRSGDETR